MGPLLCSPSMLHLSLGLNCRAVVAGAEFCMGHWVATAVSTRTGETRPTQLSVYHGNHPTHPQLTKDYVWLSVATK